MPALSRRSPVPLLLLLLVVLVVALLVVARPAVADSREASTDIDAVVDAVDDAAGSRWEAADGSTIVTIAPGESVEWRFDRAGQGHDLTSEDSRTPWPTPVAEYRAPGDPAFAYTFEQPGIYEYVCSLHGTVMRGTVVVQEAGANQPPAVAPMATPQPGSLTVDFMAHGLDPDGDPVSYRWDFGDDGAGSTVENPRHTYAAAGTYTATVEASDGRGGTATGSVSVTVDDAADVPLPQIAAHAHTGTPEEPHSLDVAFATTVTTAGRVMPFADGSAAYPGLDGTATLVRDRGRTHATLDLTGLKPGAPHLVHVHEQACGDGNGGAHFRFDETGLFEEANEIWLPFTSDAEGRSGLVEVTQPLRAGPRAVSLVVHDPDNPAKRIGCVDYAPSTAGLDYHWDFGDGTTGSGHDPDHTYARAGTYTASVTVSSALGSGEGVTDDVVVSVGDQVAPRTTLVSAPRGVVASDRAVFRFASTEPGTYECRLDAQAWRACRSGETVRGLRDGPHRLRVRAVDLAGNRDPVPRERTWTVDTTGPTIGGLGPRGTVGDRTPTLRARITDRHATVAGRTLVLRVDGRLVDRARGLRWDAVRGRLAWTPPRALAPGRHVVRLVVADAVGNRSDRTWWFTVRR